METILIKINSRVLDTSLKNLTIFGDAIGSITAPVIEYISSNTITLIKGIRIIKIKVISPTMPIPFYYC